MSCPFNNKKVLLLLSITALIEKRAAVDAPIGRNPKDRKKMAVDKKEWQNGQSHITRVLRAILTNTVI